MPNCVALLETAGMGPPPTRGHRRRTGDEPGKAEAVASPGPGLC
jgi:hypothetical protein